MTPIARLQSAIDKLLVNKFIGAVSLVSLCFSETKKKTLYVFARIIAPPTLRFVFCNEQAKLFRQTFYQVDDDKNVRARETYNSHSSYR